MLPFLAPLIAGLLPVLAETAADKLIGDGHPMADTAKRIALDVARTVVRDQIGDATAAGEAALQISGDPAMKAEFVKLMNERIGLELSAETDRLRAHLSDMQGARNREAATGDRTVAYLAYLVFGLWAAQTTWLFVMGPPAGVPEGVLTQSISTVTNIIMLVAGYYWGSSHLPGRKPG